MMRFIRFFAIFRDIVRRSADVIPAISGPLLLIISVMHIFTYVGMMIWGGAVEVGAHADSIEPFYDLNNFNDYTSGIVTMFQVLVVNDWHAIAAVFLHADKCSSPAVVYPFFIGANIVSVSILLNVLTAFFVGAFVVTRVESSHDNQNQALNISVRSFNIAFINARSSQGSVEKPYDERRDTEFQAFERQGFDKIMETVAGENQTEMGWSKRICEILETFESLTPRTAKVGYLVCCSQSEDRFGNRRFQTMMKEFLEEDEIHMIISDMHSELLSLVNKGQTIVQRFLESVDSQLELSASLMSTSPPMSLFTANVVTDESE